MNIKDNIEIIKLDDETRGIAYIDNKITFIDNALPGEIVDIEITKETKKYNEGKVINYKQLSNDRIDSICSYYKLCGGCSLLHVDYKYSVNYKKDKVKNILKKFGNIDKDIEFIENKKIFNYRNKIE